MANYVSATGGTKRQRRLAQDVAYWCIKELMPRHRTLDIEIILTKCFEDGAAGFCYALETEREFEVCIDKRLYPADKNEFILTICHEVVHVMQTAKGLLVDRVYPKKLGYRRFWKCPKTGKLINHTKTPYSKQPWERQAYRMQEELFKKFPEAAKNA